MATLLNAHNTLKTAHFRYTAYQKLRRHLESSFKTLPVLQ
jgi:hypothetical protein